MSRKRRARGLVAQTTGEQGGTGRRRDSGEGRSGRRFQPEQQPVIPNTRTYGERPRAPWHPLPISEILILAGAIAVVVALMKSAKGAAPAAPPLIAGIAAVAIGTFEVTIREHRSGYRSHTILLAAIPVLVFHTVAILAITVAFKVSQLVNLALFVIDLALFWLLFRLLRSTFLTARVRSAGRR